MARVVHAVDVEIEGHLDPSLARAVGMTNNEFKRLEGAAKTFNSLMSKMVVPREAVQATNQMSSALGKLESKSAEASRRVSEHMRKIGEEAKKAAEHITHGLAGAFDKIVEKGMDITGIGALGGGIGAAFATEEFVRGAFETRAERGVLQNQLRSMTESMGRPEMAPAIDAMIRNMEGRETPIRYDELMKSATLMLGADPKRFQNTEQVHKLLSQIADISRSPEAFGLASASVTKMLAEGTVDAQHLRELSVDTGFQFRAGMAKALDVSPEQMSEMMKKHKFTGSQLIDALLKSIDEATSPGGPAYGHAKAQIEGLAGIQSTFLGHWADFQESFGKQLENFLQPIASNVFRLLDAGTLTHAFDKLTGFFKSWGDAIGATVAKFQSSGIIDKFNQLGATIGKMFGADFSKFFTTTYAPGIGKINEMTKEGQAWVDATSGKMVEGIKTALETVNKTMDFIVNNFNVIKTIVADMVGVLVGAKLVEMATGVVNAFKTLAALTGLGAGGRAAAGLATAEELAGGAAMGPVGLTLGAGFVTAQLTEAWVRDHAKEVVTDLKEHAEKVKGGTVETQYKAGAFPDSPEMRNLMQKHQEAAEAVDKVGKASSTAAGPLNSISPAASSAAGALNTLASKISSFQMPTIPGGAPASPSGPVQMVPPHASGGIVTRPHVGLIGEKGPEAIIPLSKAAGLLGGGINVHAPITINGASDTGSLSALLAEHAQEIARQVQRIFEIQMEQNAIV